MFNTNNWMERTEKYPSDDAAKVGRNIDYFDFLIRCLFVEWETFYEALTLRHLIFVLCETRP